MSGYGHINIKKTTLKKFRVFAPTVALTFSEALDKMMHFFERHSISPDENLGPHMTTLERKLKKRIDAVIAIIRDIEKTQTKPTIALLHVYLEKQLQEEPVKLHERKFDPITPEPARTDTVARIRYEKLKAEHENLKQEFLEVLEQVTEVQPSFGKKYLKLEYPLSEIHKKKRDLKK